MIYYSHTHVWMHITHKIKIAAHDIVKWNVWSFIWHLTWFYSKHDTLCWASYNYSN